MDNKKDNIIKLKKFELSPITKKIMITLVITLVVFLFFIWLGVGMYISVPPEERSSLLPMYFIYCVFPFLIFFLGVKRIYIIINFGEDAEQQKNIEKMYLKKQNPFSLAEKIVLRPYDKDDWKRIAEIHDSARKIELKLAKLEEAFVPLERAAKNEGLFDYAVEVAVLNKKVVGFSAYNNKELAWLYIDPDYMHRGIGKKLVESVLEKEKGISSVEVLLGNFPARNLYEKMGFKLVSTESGSMPGNESFRVIVWCMKRENNENRPASE